jgi:hypothetical protein
MTLPFELKPDDSGSFRRPRVESKLNDDARKCFWGLWITHHALAVLIVHPVDECRSRLGDDRVRTGADPDVALAALAYEPLNCLHRFGFCNLRCVAFVRSAPRAHVLAIVAPLAHLLRRLARFHHADNRFEAVGSARPRVMYHEASCVDRGFALALCRRKRAPQVLHHLPNRHCNAI